MFSRIKRSPRKYAIYAGAAVLIISGYIWQARTTIEYRENAHRNLCWHAHLNGHQRTHPPYYDTDGKRLPTYSPVDVGFEFVFIRHYHRSPLVSCEIRPGQRWGTSEESISFEVRENEPSDDWPERPGMYVFVKHTDEQRYPIYVSHANNLKETLRNPSNHEKWSCLTEEGPATHIHARLTDGRVSDDVAFLVDTFNPPCNESRED